MNPAAVEAFAAAIRRAGIDPPPTIVGDGTLHRFPTNGNSRDTAGWYVLHLDGVPAGCFGCWRQGINETWCSRSASTMSAAEREAHRSRMEQAKKTREHEEKMRHHQALMQAADL